MLCHEFTPGVLMTRTCSRKIGSPVTALLPVMLGYLQLMRDFVFPERPHVFRFARSAMLGPCDLAMLQISYPCGIHCMRICPRTKAPVPGGPVSGSAANPRGTKGCLGKAKTS